MAFNMRNSMVAERQARTGGTNNESTGKVDAFFTPHEEVRETILPDGKHIDQYGEQVFDYEEQHNPYIHDHPEDVIAYWEGPEYEVYPKSTLWYTVVGIIIALIALFAVWTDSPVMAITFLLIGAVGFLYLNTAPRVLEYAITADGIVVGDRIFHYDEIDSFWIFYEPPHTRIISLHVESRIMPYVHIPLHQLDPVEVREALAEHIQERRQEPTLVDTVERLLHI